MLISNISIAQSANSDDAEDSWTKRNSWSWTIDDDNDGDRSFFRWWQNGGDFFSQMMMELFENNSNTVLKIPTSTTNAILSLAANDNRAPSDGSALPFIFLERGDARSAIFYGKDQLLNFSINSANPSSFPYAEGFRFINSNGIEITGQPSSYGTELMRITKEGSISAIGSLDLLGSTMRMFDGRNDDLTILMETGNSQRWKRIGADGNLGFWANGGADSNDYPQLMIRRDGNIGIGTPTPSEKLEVDGNINVKGGDILVDGQPLGEHLASNHRIVRRSVDGTSVDLPQLVRVKNTIGGVEHTGFINVTSSKHEAIPRFWMGSETMLEVSIMSNNSERIRILPTGETIIGAHAALASISQSNLDKYSLFVQEGMISEDYWLAAKESWSDHVFKENYPLKPLKEVAEFIEKNKHLPNIPTQQEVQEEGYGLHDINVRFLEKIEELTLYTIEQEEKIEELSAALEKQQVLIEQLLQEKN